MTGRNKKNRNWTATDAERALAGWAQSGMVLSAYSRKLGLHPQRLGWWRRRLLKKKGSAPQLKKTVSGPMRLIPAVVRDDVRSSGGIATVVIRVSSVAMLEVSHGDQLSPQWLAELVHELGKAER